jgi:hypothetical protein
MKVRLTRGQIAQIRELAKEKRHLGKMRATMVAFAKVVGKFLPECKIVVVK